MGRVNEELEGEAGEHQQLVVEIKLAEGEKQNRSCMLNGD